MLKTDIENFILANRKNGKRGCFMWDFEGLRNYVNWSFVNDYLLYAIDDNKISGVAVAYPLPAPFDGSIKCLLPSDEEIKTEPDKDLVVMDWVAVNKNSRKALVSQFTRRFWNWENQRKYGIHYGKVKELSNTYINKLNTI